MKVLTTINKRNVKMKQQISQNIKEENWRKRQHVDVITSLKQLKKDQRNMRVELHIMTSRIQINVYLILEQKNAFL